MQQPDAPLAVVWQAMSAHWVDCRSLLYEDFFVVCKLLPLFITVAVLIWGWHLLWLTDKAVMELHDVTIELPDFTMELPDFKIELPDFTRELPDFTRELPDLTMEREPSWGQWENSIYSYLAGGCRPAPPAVVKAELGPGSLLQEEMLLAPLLEMDELLYLSEAATWLVPTATSWGSSRSTGGGLLEARPR
jgi:hypothetical protein